MSTFNQELHDILLKYQPQDSVAHVPNECIHCSERASEEDTHVDEKIFDQNQHEQLLTAAVDAAVKDARAEGDEELIRLNAELETVQAELESVTQEAQELRDDIASREENTRLEQLANARAEQVTELKTFSDEQIAARKDAWAKMDDDEFQAQLADYKAIFEAASEAAKGEKETVPPTTFDGTRESAGEGSDMKAIQTFLSTVGGTN